MSRSNLLHGWDQLSLHVADILVLCAYRGVLSQAADDASAGVPSLRPQLEDRCPPRYENRQEYIYISTDTRSVRNI
jgi:hypothetical protein